jgi:hypothetical protein
MYFGAHKSSAIGRGTIVVIVLVVLFLAGSTAYYHYVPPSNRNGITSTSTASTAAGGTPIVTVLDAHIYAVTANAGSGETTMDCTTATAGNTTESYLKVGNSGTGSATVITIYLVYNNVSTSSPPVHQYNAPGLSCVAPPGSYFYMNVRDLKIPPTGVKSGDNFTGIVQLQAPGGGVDGSVNFSGTFL